jgi:hypothetical protein
MHMIFMHFTDIKSLIKETAGIRWPRPDRFLKKKVFRLYTVVSGLQVKVWHSIRSGNIVY